MRQALIVALYAGPVIQDYQLTPTDPGSRLHGFYVGGETAADIWFQPNAVTMAALNGAISSIGPTGYVRAAFGIRTFVPAFIGPEIEQIWCANFQELELGAQLTALRVNAVEWSLGTGLALTSDRRSGLYVRFGADERY
ncbi:MAG: cellulose biosynthesis protein BcsS [Xanthobacteraceae bacterium]